MLRHHTDRTWLTQPAYPYACCQLLSAANARLFLGRPVEFEPPPTEGPPPFGAWLFEQFVDLARCRYGSAISIRRAWRCLRLHGEQVVGLWSYEWVAGRLAEGRPVAVSAMSNQHGFHSALAVEASDRSLTLVNWEHRHPVSVVNWDSLRCPGWWGNWKLVAFSLL